MNGASQQQLNSSTNDGNKIKMITATAFICFIGGMLVGMWLSQPPPKKREKSRSIVTGSGELKIYERV